MRKWKFFVFLVALLFVSKVAFAGEIDILVQKLVDKGILSPGEAQQIVTETKEEVKKEIAKGTYSSLPSWVQNTKIKGDFRLRYQYDHSKALANAVARDQQRARIRLRLGLESKVNDKLLVGIGLATGKSDGSADAARSTNVTLGDGGFGKKPIALDYAFAQYSATPWATVVGGKFKNPLWEPGDLIWDTDINPEGAAVKLSTTKLIPKTELFMNAGVLLPGNSSTWSADPTLYALQPGFVYNLNDSIQVKGAFSFYEFSGVKGKVLSGNAGTNSGATTGLTYDYRNIIPAMEVGVKEPLKFMGVNLPYFALFGEYVENIALNADDVNGDNNTGYMLGLKFGAEKVEKWADWQFRYNYAMLGKDAVLDTFPDSDRYGGKTGMRSHEVMFDWGLGKNTWVGLDGYYGWQIPGNFSSKQTKPASVVQVDWNMKF